MTRSTVALVALAIGAGLLPFDSVAQSADPAVWPRVVSPDAITDADTERRIDRLLETMTLEEKVGQIIQADIDAIKPEDLAHYPLGSVLAGGNSAPNLNNMGPASDWVDLSRAFRAAVAARPGARVPLLFGIDAVHGHNNAVGATLFPHNIGLGAARDPDLIRRIGEVTALEVAATGQEWTFGPTLAVPRDDRWGRSYEGYSEDPEIVAAYAGAMTLGLQGELHDGRPLSAGHIAGSAKHFVADGGTRGGVDQGDAVVSEADLIAVHAAGYPPAIEAGVLTVMASYSSWNGIKHHGNRSLLTDVLKGQMGFQGFVVGDWNGHGQIPGCTNVSCPQAINAGLDMFMAPDSWRGLYDNTLDQVRSGEIPPARLDDAVRRILRVKAKLGLFEAPRTGEGRLELLGAPAHRALAREAVRKSLVLLKNDGVLPIRGGSRVLVAGSGADDIGRQAGGWTLTWQGTGTTRADFPNAQTIWEGLEEAIEASGGAAELNVDGEWSERPDVAVVVFGEEPYAEFQGDRADLDFADDAAIATLRKLQADGIPTVSVFLSGRPLWTNPEINASNAFVAAWLPGSEGGGVADLLIGDTAGEPRHDFSGKLSFSWPRDAVGAPLNRGQADYNPQFAYGFGLAYASPTPAIVLPEASGLSAAPAGSVERLYVDGRAGASWAISLDGALTTRRVDRAAQEDALALTWSGPGAFLISGPAADLSRQTRADMAVQIRYRLDAPLRSDLTVGVQCGDACGVPLDLAALMGSAPVGEWRTVKVKLSCFAAGAGMEAVTVPLALRASGPGQVSVSDLRIVSNEGDAVCP